MSLSASKNYAVTRSDIISGALRKLGEYDQGEAPSGDETAAASVALNLMVKEWVADGADLFLRDEITLFLQPGTSSYSLGGTAHATASYVETTLSAAASAGATALSLTSSTGISAADNIGIKLDDDSIHWTTISSGTTITNGLESSAASGNRVYAYTTAAGRPQKILHAYRRDSSGLDTQVTIVGESEYQRISDKTSSGAPVEVFYRQTISTGTLFAWPTDGGANVDKLVLIVQTLPDDLDSSSNNPQFPIEWGSCLIWNLAAELAPEYGVSGGELKSLWSVGQAKLNKLLDYDVEGASVIFGLDHAR